MRVRVTVYYGDEGTPLTKETKKFSLTTQDVDSQSFDEALDFLTESILEPYTSDGHDLEDDEEETAIGTDYLAAWILPEWFDDRADAMDFLKEIVSDTNQVLADLE